VDTHKLEILIEAKNKASAALESVGLSLGGVAAAAAAAAALLAGFVHVMSEGIAKASEEEQAQMKLAFALASVGAGGKQAREDMFAFVESLETSTTVADTTIYKISSLLAVLGRLSGESLKRATRAVLDFSYATGKDAETAAFAFAKAAQGNMTALQRLGLRVTATGDRVADFNSLLKKVEGNMTGAAGIALKTYQGAIDSVGIRWERLLKTLGRAVTENQAVRDAIFAFARLLESLTSWIESHRETFDKLITLFARVAEATLNAAVKTGTFVSTWSRWIPVVGKGVQALDVLNLLMGKTATSTVKAADAVDTLGAGLTGLGQESELSSLDQALKKVGAQTGAEFEQKLKDVNAALTMLDKEELTGTLSPMTYKALRNSLEGVQKQLQDLMMPIEEIKGDEGFPAVGDEIQGLADLGLPTIKALNDELEAIAMAFEQIKGGPALGLLDPAAAERMNEQLLGVIDNLRQMGVAVVSPFTQAEELMLSIEQGMRGVLMDSAMAFGDTLAAAMTGAAVDWRQFAIQVIRDLIGMILKAIIFRAIMSFMGGLFGPGAEGGEAAAVNALPDPLHAAPGGQIAGGILGRDSVRALLMPGEVVLPARLRGDFQAISDFARRVKDGGGDMGAPTYISNRIEAGNRREKAVALVEEINSLVERHGFRLVASEVVA
jgi:hypothetical protein